VRSQQPFRSKLIGDPLEPFELFVVHVVRDHRTTTAVGGLVVALYRETTYRTTTDGLWWFRVVPVVLSASDHP
jgi:hypothetical protein